MKKCLPCSKRCKTCDDEGEFCTACSKTYTKYNIEDGSFICTLDCPSGYSVIKRHHECHKKDDFTFQFNFFEHASAKNTVKGITLNPSDVPPIPAYNRGVYLDGHSYFTLQDLNIGFDYTLGFWIKPEEFKSLFTVWDVDESLKMKMTSSSSNIFQVAIVTSSNKT